VWSEFAAGQVEAESGIEQRRYRLITD